VAGPGDGGRIDGSGTGIDETPTGSIDVGADEEIESGVTSRATATGSTDAGSDSSAPQTTQ
jgi:hypothetical protein